MLRKDKATDKTKNIPGRPKKLQVSEKDETFRTKFMQDFLEKSKNNK